MLLEPETGSFEALVTLYSHAFAGLVFRQRWGKKNAVTIPATGVLPHGDCADTQGHLRPARLCSQFSHGDGDTPGVNVQML
jgi:hypothetical protein